MTYPFIIKKLLFRSGMARHIGSLRRLAGGSGTHSHHYSDRVLAGPSYKEIKSAGELRELQSPDAINLALDAPRFDLVSSVTARLPAEKQRVAPPQGLLELRRLIAPSAAGNPSLNPEDLLITPGASGAFSIILDTFMNPADGAVLFGPGSPLYPRMLRQRRARTRYVSTWMDNGIIRFRFDRLAKRLRRAKLIVINSPANPTGGVFAVEDLEQVAWWASRRDVVIVNDRVFANYDYDRHGANIALIPKAATRTLTIGSVSKSHGLGSLHVGWLAGNKELVRPCALTASVQGVAVPTICQQIAVRALGEMEREMEKSRADFDSRRRYTFERLQAMGLKAAWPAGAFFFWIEVGSLGVDGRLYAQRLFTSKKVLVTPGNSFGPSGPSHIRLSYATESGRLREGLNRMCDFMREQSLHSQMALKVA